jgi:DNA-binding response OmpR family regulator
MRILIVEDDPRIADFLKRGLAAEGHYCVIADNGDAGFALAREGDFDFVLLDLMLPGMDGRDICQQLRMLKVKTPLIMLTAMDSLDDVIAGLHMGADDYMTKPFSFEELLARIDTVVRRGADITSNEETDLLTLGPLAFDRKSMKFYLDDEEIELTAKELAIIELLMSHPGTLFSRERILSNVWGLNMDPLTNVVDVYIGKLRKKIDKDNVDSMIQTVRGLGYRLNLPD